MHFGFFIPDHSAVRILPLSYENYIDGAGFSGTEASLLEITKGLEERGHYVTIFSEKNNPPLSDFDFFCPLFFLSSSVKELCAKLRDDCIVAVWLHCYIANDTLLDFEATVAPRPFHVIAVSATVAKHVPAHFKNVHIVPNGINKEIWSEPASSGRSPNHVFIATYERGGAIAAIVARQLGKKIVHASYYQPQPSQNLSNLFSLSKRQIKALLDSSDIFVYPLVLPDGSVHHDTYACCVHEAMASGVIVVTWDVACFRDVYPEGTMVLVPPLSFPGYDPRAKYGFNPALASPEAIARLCSAVAALDRDLERKERIRRSAQEWALQRTWDESVHFFCDFVLDKNKINDK